MPPTWRIFVSSFIEIRPLRRTNWCSRTDGRTDIMLSPPAIVGEGIKWTRRKLRSVISVWWKPRKGELRLVTALIFIRFSDNLMSTIFISGCHNLTDLLITKFDLPLMNNLWRCATAEYQGSTNSLENGISSIYCKLCSVIDQVKVRLHLNSPACASGCFGKTLTRAWGTRYGLASMRCGETVSTCSK